MKHSADIHTELKEIAPRLAEMGKANIFSVPENYFAWLDVQILKKIKGDLSYVTPAFEPPLSGVPEEYFENLATNILQKIKTSDNADSQTYSIQPGSLIYSVRDENVFTVPEGYFETFPETVLNIVKPQAKVVPIKKRSFIWQTAAAAVFTGAMAVGALLVSNNSSNTNSITADTKAVSLNVKYALEYKNQQQISEGIAGLSDADIIKYLETSRNNTDDEMLASGVPDKDLPDEQDYLTNENTLQIFLKKIQPDNTQN